MNEFRLDFLEYVKMHDDLDKKPFGLYVVAYHIPESGRKEGT